jgi:hypothetical protein
MIQRSLEVATCGGDRAAPSATIRAAKAAPGGGLLRSLLSLDVDEAAGLALPQRRIVAV